MLENFVFMYPSTTSLPIETALSGPRVFIEGAGSTLLIGLGHSIRSRRTDNVLKTKQSLVIARILTGDSATVVPNMKSGWPTLTLARQCQFRLLDPGPGVRSFIQKYRRAAMRIWRVNCGRKRCVKKPVLQLKHLMRWQVRLPLRGNNWLRGVALSVCRDPKLFSFQYVFARRVGVTTF